MQLTKGKGVEGFCWSPDGQDITFVRNGQVWVMGAGGGEPSQLTQSKGASGVLWGPDGKHIAFERDSGLWVMNADGTNVTKLMAKVEWPPMWTREGRGLRFISDGHIWTARPDGSDKRKLAGLPDETDGWSFSDDARFLVFHTHRVYGEYEEWFDDALSVLDMETGEVTRLLEEKRCADYEEGYFYAASLSPDGKYVVCGYKVGHDWGDETDIQVIRAAGGDSLVLRDPSHVAGRGKGLDLDRGFAYMDARWSPAGDKIVCRYLMWLHDEAVGYRAPGGLAIVDVARNEWVYVAEEVREYAFSPDGTKLAFTVFTREDEEEERADLWTCNVDGSNLRQIAEDAHHPQWAPLPKPSVARTPRPKSLEGRKQAPSPAFAVKGAERKAILDTIRKAWGKTDKFLVHHLAAKDGWCYAVVEPHRPGEVSSGWECGYFLLEKREGNWQALEGPRPWLDHWLEEWSTDPCFALEPKLMEKHPRAPQEVFER